MWQSYRTYISYLSIVFGVLIIILSIYNTDSWEDLKSNYLGFIVGIGFIMSTIKVLNLKKMINKNPHFSFLILKKGLN